MNETDRGVAISVEAIGSGPSREQQPAGSTENRQLVSRFLLGLLLLGGDELLRYLRTAQRESEASAAPPGQAASGNETKHDLLAYLALGALAQSQRRVARSLRRGMHHSAAAVEWAVGAMDWLTDNPLGHPFRGPIESRLNDLAQEGERVVRNGRREAQRARQLASQTLGLIARDVVAGVADSPTVTESIQQIVGGQGVELAGTVMDSARQFSAGADSRAEGMVRRLFRRGPRRDLPPSPLAGKPQTMYMSWDRTQDGEQDDRRTLTR